jgi:hypothetical protein
MNPTLGDTGEHGNYNSHPQGIVKLYDHDEIDRLCDVIDNYNGLPDTTARHDLHRGLEFRRDELEQMSVEDGVDYGEAMLSVSFFVEKKNDQNSLTLGYWNYEVDEWDINEWFSYGGTYNKDYEMYDSIEQVENLFKNYQNPNLMKESDDFDWVGDITPTTLEFWGNEIWVDITNMDREERSQLVEYIRSTVKFTEDSTYIGDVSTGNYTGILIHCAHEDYDYIPREGHICLMSISYDEDDGVSENTTYVNGNDFLYMIKNLNESEEDDFDWIKDNTIDATPLEGRKYKICLGCGPNDSDELWDNVKTRVFPKPTQTVYGHVMKLGMDVNPSTLTLKNIYNLIRDGHIRLVD